ncbi:hypothetical protein GOP47_0012003 [Adiantum capillus-veneris]|uniref:Late embryogenesis abundant protein LEA-2 subgroup domain-containing protein n=1 Tax=Adiantum capillus-veneris TaxID=13818 RepID=A0A9D4ZI83_ADICA|nr:hypothetical protein GOP47_0012003 [Adiantum capillus-veneris]
MESPPHKPFSTPSKDVPCCTLHITFTNKTKLFLIMSSTFLLLFTLLFFIMLAGAHVHVSVENPTIATFQVLPPNTTSSSPSSSSSKSTDVASTLLQQATDADNSPFLLNSDVVLSLDIKNPTPKFGTYFYEPLKWHLRYEGISIASGVLPPFSQGANAAQHPRQVRLQGKNVTVPPSLAFALQSNSAMLKVEASTSFYVHLKGSVFKFGYVTHCNLTLPHFDDGYMRLSKKTTCLIADQDRGHY